MRTLKTAAIPLLAFLAMLLAACGSSGGDSSPATLAPGAKLKVVATTVQIMALAKEVGGSAIELKGLVPAGADPHDFEPIASDLASIEGANVILRHGLGLDDWLDDALKAGKKAQVATVTKGIKVHEEKEGGKTVDDPHVWHDPDNAKIMVADIATALSTADPEHKTTYEANAAVYRQKLDDTKVRVQAIINEIPPASRKLVTDHDAFGYFADAFGLTVVGAVIPSVSTEAEPSASSTSALLDTIKKENVKAIFAEETANPKLATSLAADANVKMVDDLYGDSLGKPGSGAETLDGMLLVNARKIADALK